MSAGLWWNAHCGPSWGLRSVRSVWGGCVTAVVGKVEVDLGDRAGMVLLRPLDVAAVLAERLEDHLDRPRLAGQDRPIEGRLGVVQAGLAGIVGHLLELRVALNELPDRGAGDAETAGDRGQIPRKRGIASRSPGTESRRRGGGATLLTSGGFCFLWLMTSRLALPPVQPLPR